ATYEISDSCLTLFIPPEQGLWLPGEHTPEIELADSWGDSAWGGPDHVEEAILNVRSVFVATEELGGLAAYVAGRINS
ncbi:MAG TPA: hypothetical protein VHN18_15545, partial [Micromonosporaceae bacterium]|nr:hypothetical protein [Micromonosporaceae bacterium]